MLSYRHIFHAGNHADVLKHLTLCIILESLNEKEKPYTVIDTHAGSGRYYLDDERLKKNAEMESGIKKVLLNENAIEKLAPVSKYFPFASECLKKGFYPGSAEIEMHFMRRNDCLILCELHSAEVEELKQNMKIKRDEKKHTVPHIHHRNGFEALSSLTPPEIKRGLTIIDPSYEDKIEYENVSASFSKAFSRWSNATYAIWYPLLAHRKIECSSMRQKIIAFAKSANANSEIVEEELSVNESDSHIEKPLSKLNESKDENPPRLYGSGMLVVNAPWKLKEKLQLALPILQDVLSGDR